MGRDVHPLTTPPWSNLARVSRVCHLIEGNGVALFKVRKNQSANPMLTDDETHMMYRRRSIRVDFTDFTRRPFGTARDFRTPRFMQILATTPRFRIGTRRADDLA